MSFCHQVTWYTCTSTSILPCKELKPFLEFYEVPKTTILYSLNDDPSYWNNQLSQILQAQFNKGQTGSYPEAVTLATEDARQVEKIIISIIQTFRNSSSTSLIEYNVMLHIVWKMFALQASSLPLAGSPHRLVSELFCARKSFEILNSFLDLPSRALYLVLQPET